MRKVSLGDVYSVLAEVEQNFPESTADLAELKSEADGADEELSHDYKLFADATSQLTDAQKCGDLSVIGDKFVYLRIYAMNISTIFSNLADSIEDVVFTSDDEQ